MGLKIATRTSFSTYEVLDQAAPESTTEGVEVDEELVYLDDVLAVGAFILSDESVGGNGDDEDEPDSVGGNDDDEDEPDSVGGEDAGDTPDTAGGVHHGGPDSIGGQHGAQTDSMGHGDGNAPDSVGGHDNEGDEEDDEQFDEPGAE